MTLKQAINSHQCGSVLFVVAAYFSSSVYGTEHRFTAKLIEVGEFRGDFSRCWHCICFVLQGIVLVGESWQTTHELKIRLLSLVSACEEADDDDYFRTINLIIPDLRYIIVFLGMCEETMIQNSRWWGIFQVSIFATPLLYILSQIAFLERLLVLIFIATCVIHSEQSVTWTRGSGLTKTTLATAELSQEFVWAFCMLFSLINYLNGILVHLLNIETGLIGNFDLFIRSLVVGFCITQVILFFVEDEERGSFCSKKIIFINDNSSVFQVVSVFLGSSLFSVLERKLLASFLFA